MRAYPVLVSCLLAVSSACVGDTPVSNTGNDAGNGSDTSTLDDGSKPDTSTSSDAALTCDGGTTLCSGACVDLGTDGANCGACGHDCGGGTCTKGACDSMVVVDTLDHPVFDVDATQIYYSTGDKVLACPKGGCKAAPKQLAAMGVPVYGSNAGGTIMAGTTTLAFTSDNVQNTSRPKLYACDIKNGCPATPTVLYDSGLQGLGGSYDHAGDNFYWNYYHQVGHASCASGTCTSENIVAFGFNVPAVKVTTDGNSVYFNTPAAYTPSAALQSCPKSGTCTATTLWGGPTTPTALANYGGKLYLLSSGPQGGIPAGVISTCPTTGACGTPTKYQDKQAYPLLLAVDASGVYWFNSDPPLSGDPGQIVTCPLSGCQGGPKTLATKQAGAAVLHTDDKFVYWATATQILRVAK